MHWSYVLATAAALAPTPLAAGAPAGGRDPISSIFAGQTVSGAAIACTAQGNGTRECHGTYNNGTAGTDLRLKSFDGTPLAVYVTLPPAPSSGADGPYPADHPEPRLGRADHRSQRQPVLRPDGRRLGLAGLRRAPDHRPRVRRLLRQRGLARRRPHRLPERLHPPRRRALRGPRRAVRRRPARRRGRGEPERDRRHRRVLRRRGVARAGHAQQPRDEHRRHAQPVDEPERHAAAHRRRRAGDPVERSDLLADAQRAHARLRRDRRHGRPLPDRRREAVVRHRPVRRGQRERLLRAARHQLPGRSDELVRRHQRRRALRRQRGRRGAGHPDRPVPLALLPARRRLRLRPDAAGSAAHRQRVHR